MSLCMRIGRTLSPKDLGLMIEKFQIDLAGNDKRVGNYALDFNNPQALRLMLDAYPTLISLINQYPRMSELTFLDVGPAFGASAGLISQMHRSHFLGPKIKVDVLDIVDSRRKFIEFTHPHVNFIHSSLENLPISLNWDFIYCSNVIEHVANPKLLLNQILLHTKGFAIILAPYREQEPLSHGHLVHIDESTFSEFTVVSIHIFNTQAWPTTSDGVERLQILAVLKGMSD